MVFTKIVEPERATRLLCRPPPLGALRAWLLAETASPLSTGSEGGPRCTFRGHPRRGALDPSFSAERYAGVGNHPPGVRWTGPVGTILVTSNTHRSIRTPNRRTSLYGHTHRMGLSGRRRCRSSSRATSHTAGPAVDQCSGRRRSVLGGRQEEAEDATIEQPGRGRRPWWRLLGHALRVDFLRAID